MSIFSGVFPGDGLGLGESDTLVPEDDCFGLMKCWVKRDASACFL